MDHLALEIKHVAEKIEKVESRLEGVEASIVENDDAIKANEEIMKKAQSGSSKWKNASSDNERLREEKKQLWAKELQLREEKKQLGEEKKQLREEKKQLGEEKRQLGEKELQLGEKKQLREKELEKEKQKTADKELEVLKKKEYQVKRPKVAFPENLEEACPISYIYVLKLENGYYYVGSSNNVSRRFQEHISGQGSAWTRKHKPLRVLKILKKTSKLQEDSVTEELMAEMGIEKVRGGTFCKIELSPDALRVLTRKFQHAANLCLNCGSKDHFANKCKDIKKESKWLFLCEGCSFKSEFEEIVDEHEITCKGMLLQTKTCNRCGREGHQDSQCYAKTIISAPKVQTCNRCGREGHQDSQCYAKTSAFRGKKQKNKARRN